MSDATTASDYQAIFDERGGAYHQAMLEFPRARDEEFREIVRWSRLVAGQTLCDAPSGGGYLQDHLPDGEWALIALETSATFHRLCASRRNCRAILTSLDQIELPDATVDRVISLAGLHHLPDRNAFFREAHRILKPGGALVVADVLEGTDVARFLNVFVDGASSMGHRGTFLDATVARELEAAGFAIDDLEHRRYTWSFRTVDDMVRCVTLLFGLDRASPADVREGIARHLGFEADDDGCRMNWGLLFVRGVRPRPIATGPTGA